MSQSALYLDFQRALAHMRRSAGLTQRQLAKKLGRERSFVSRIELGERRLDFVEFYWVCGACDCDPISVASQLFASFIDLHKAKRKTRQQEIMLSRTFTSSVLPLQQLAL